MGIARHVLCVLFQEDICKAGKAVMLIEACMEGCQIQQGYERGEDALNNLVT